VEAEHQMASVMTAAPETGPWLVKVSEAARIAGVSRSVGYELVKRGVWPSLHISPKLIRVPLRDLQAWIDAEKRPGRSLLSQPEEVAA
jgi:predicted DNA-binding transcriptional regulator AlpA